MTPSEPPSFIVPPEPHQDPNAPGCGSYVLLAAVGGWALLASLFVQLFAWSAEQALITTAGNSLPGFVWLPIALGQIIVMGLPILVLALLTKAPALRAVYVTWSAACLFVVVLSLARVFPLTSNQSAAFTQVVLSLLFAAGLILVLRARGWRPRQRPGGVALALGLSPLLALPLMLGGALGSPLDSALNALAGLSLGLVAGLLLDGFLFGPRAVVGPETDAAAGRRGRLLGAWAVTVTLGILGSGFGVSGTQLLLLVVLTPLGLVAGAIAARAWAGDQAGTTAPSTWLALTLLVGVVAAVTLMFFDPDELLPFILSGDALRWAFRGAFQSGLLSLLAGIVLLAVAARPRAPTPASEAAPVPARRARPLGWLAAIPWLAALLLYALAGQPGFYGEKLYVVMRAQADLSAAAAIPDRVERLTYVYTTLVAQADSTQAGIRRFLDSLRVDYQPYYLENGIEVDGGPLLRAYLASRPEVDRVMASPRLRPLPERPRPSEGEDGPPAAPRWNITSIGADRVWEELGITGAGIIVGHSDSGVDGTHPALASSYLGRETGDDYHWYDPWYGSTEPVEYGFHGTHTLGSVLGQGGIGVAPGAQWIGCANLARNLANPPLYLDCLQFHLAPFPQGGDPLRDGEPARAAHVLNNSWGCPALEGCDARVMGPAIAALRAAGLFVVASAGNEGPGCSSLDSPISLFDEAFSVGAVDNNGNLATFSSRGPVTVDGSDRLKPDLAAPGVDVLSSMPGGTYGTTSGTSMAGPHVAGAVALLWSANPALIGDIDRTEQILYDSAQPFPDVHSSATGGCDDGPLPNNGVGFGLLDAYAAVQLALTASP